MELSHCACLVGLKVLQVETANDVVFTPDVLRDEVNLFTTKHAPHQSAKKGGIPVLEIILQGDHPLEKKSENWH